MMERLGREQRLLVLERQLEQVLELRLEQGPPLGQVLELQLEQASVSVSVSVLVPRLVLE
jgi:hypothetical protein